MAGLLSVKQQGFLPRHGQSQAAFKQHTNKQSSQQQPFFFSMRRPGREPHAESAASSCCHCCWHHSVAGRILLTGARVPFLNWHNNQTPSVCVCLLLCGLQYVPVSGKQFQQEDKNKLRGRAAECQEDALDSDCTTCPEPFCGVLFHICVGNTIRTAEMCGTLEMWLYQNLSYCCAALSHLLHYNRLRAAAVTHANNDVLYVAQTAPFFFFHYVHCWCMQSSKFH